MRIQAPLVVLFLFCLSVAADDAPKAAVEVRAEVLKPNISESGRPLPAVAHWHSRFATLEMQIEMLKRGHHVLPFTYMVGPNTSVNKLISEGGELPIAAPMKTLAEWNMPFTMITGGQWKGALYERPEFADLPPEKSPLVINAETGKIQKVVSPFGPEEVWQDLGRYWTDTPYFKAMIEAYPNPPRVFCVSNNEAHTLRWHDLENSKRYVEQHGLGRSADYQRIVLEDNYYRLHRAMFAGLRDGLASDTWKTNVRFLGYGSGLGPDHMGRGPDMDKWLNIVEEERPARSDWEGDIPEAYDNHWETDKFDHQVWSCQIEMMNLVFMKKKMLAANPDYWLETIHWDGSDSKALAYEKRGLLYTSDRYAAWVQYVYWTLTPRVVRQWNGNGDDIVNWGADWAALVRSVDVIYADPVLTRFWRFGELVANRSAEHPFNYDIPKKWQDEDRFFHLSTDQDPPRPWELTTKLPVLTLARVIGEAPNREWLLYTHAPLGDIESVRVTIPEYQDVTVASTLAGRFYHIQEADGSITRVGRPEQVVYASNEAPQPQPDAYTVVVDERLEVTPFVYSGGPTVLANDADPEADAMHVTLATKPVHGDLTLHADGSFVYVPAAGFVGTDSFTYTAHDATAVSAPATVTVTVIPKPALIVDDTSADFTGVAYSVAVDNLGYRGGLTVFPGNEYRVDSSSATWSFTDLKPDRYDVYATWGDFSYGRPDAVPYTMSAGDVSTTVRVDQRSLPAGLIHDETPWQLLGQMTVADGKLQVTVANGVDGRWIMADAIHVVGQKTGHSATIDDSDAGFSKQIAWNRRAEGYGKSARWVQGRKLPADEVDTAVWSLRGLAPGRYELYASWPSEDARVAGPVAYTVYGGDTELFTSKQNQRQAPQDLLCEQTWWNHLGTVTVGEDLIQIRLVAGVRKNKTRFTADAIAVFKSRDDGATQ